VTEWLSRQGDLERRADGDDLGGTMRLGGQQCRLENDSIAREAYGEDLIMERHRHRYGSSRSST
jgi:CTP synthase